MDRWGTTRVYNNSNHNIKEQQRRGKKMDGGHAEANGWAETVQHKKEMAEKVRTII